jgi:hypothetical protein
VLQCSIIPAITSYATNSSAFWKSVLQREA